MICANCVEVKDKPLTYVKCERCDGYRLMTPQELARIEKRKRP